MTYEGKGSVINSSQIWDGSKWVERSSGIVAPHDTTHSPVALYQLNETLDDTSGNALTGLTVVGTERYTEILPGIRGLVCSGNYAYVNATEASIQITGDLTLECIVVLYSLPAATLTIIEHALTGETEVTNVLYKIGVQSGGVLEYFAEQGAGVNIQYLLNRMMSVGIPVHVALVRSSNNVTFYLNGEQIGATSTGLSAPTGGASGKLYIGTNSDASQDWNGVVASVKIISSALTAAQIKAEYNRTLGPALGELS